MTTVPHWTEVPSFRPSRADINRNLFLSLASSSVQNNKQTVRSEWGSGETSNSTVATHLFCDLGIMITPLYATSSSSIFQGWISGVISEGPNCKSAIKLTVLVLKLGDLCSNTYWLCHLLTEQPWARGFSSHFSFPHRKMSMSVWLGVVKMQWNTIDNI